MPGPQAAQNLQMPDPRDWQMPCIGPGESWAQMELTDVLIINIPKSIHFLMSLSNIIAWFICSREYKVKLLINFFNPFAPEPPVTARADPGPFYPLWRHQF